MWISDLFMLSLLLGLFCLYCGIYQPECIWLLVKEKYHGENGRRYLILLAGFFIIPSLLYMLGLLSFRH